MTFTYNLASTDADILAISKVRLEIGDRTANAGAAPDGGNLSDEEIAVWLNDEDDNVMRAAARACEALSRMWTVIADYSSGPRSESLGKVAKDWADKAVSLRSLYGGSSGSAFAVETGRSDGYADAAADSE